MAGIMKELNRMLEIESKLLMAFHPQTDGQTERVNQELEQYLRMFINHRQEQWPECLGTAEFAYNNKGKKGKYERAKKFIEKIKEIQEEARAALGKAQEEIKKYVDRKRGEVDDYKVGDLVMLSTKDLKYQIVGRRTEKLTERFVGPYKVKKIVSSNAVELELPSTVKIYSIVNISRIQRYIGKVEGQRKEQPAPVIIKGEEEWEVERILDKQQIREKDKYLV